mmetsp:Transcript_118534/g.340359  ORF Transcript_118534/g.340359 Transcript_118534/m.340359 type:complete len:316 (-) Transcript_118534:47-994(-)
MKKRNAEAWQAEEDVAASVEATDRAHTRPAPPVAMHAVGSPRAAAIGTAGAPPGEPSAQGGEAAAADSADEALVYLRAVDAAAVRRSSATLTAESQRCEWRAGLEALREKRRKAFGEPAPAPRWTRLDPDALAAKLRDAGGLQELLAAQHPPRPSDAAAAVRRLDSDEAAATLRAFAAKHEKEPRSRTMCNAWISQLLDNSAGERLFAHAEGYAALTTLLEGLEARLGTSGALEEATSCLGKWRYIAELAAARRTAAAAAAAGGRDVVAVDSRKGGTTQPAEAVVDASDDDEEELAEDASGSADEGGGSGSDDGE